MRRPSVRAEGGSTVRRLMLGVVAPVLTAIALADVVSLWVASPPPSDLWPAVWRLSTGLGFAAAGCSALASVGPGRARRSAGLLLAGGALLMLALLADALGMPGAGAVSTAAAAVLSLGVLSIPARRRARSVLRVLDGLVITAGAVCVLGVATDAVEVAVGAAVTVAVAALCSGWLQFEFSAGDERRRVLWLVLGLAASIPAHALFPSAPDVVLPSDAVLGALLVALSLLLPASAAVAITAPRAVEVRSLISRFVVAAAMVVLTLAAANGGLEALQLVSGRPADPQLQALVILGIAAAFHPVLLRVRATTHELLFGGRADPVDTLSRLGSHLAAGSSPQQWLDTLRAALGVPAVALLAESAVVASSSVPTDREEDGGSGRTVVELTVGSQHVGDLVVTLHPDRTELPSTTQAVLRLVAGPLAQALHATRLAEELQASRGRVVAALEEERRRVRRDLHDGLGPTLTGIAYSADAASNLLRSDVDQAARLLHDLRNDASDAIAEIRRIVYDLRPRALDELGLVGAVRQQVSRLRAADGRPLLVDVHAPVELPELPAAVEVVAYRVAVEAVTNVAKHAGVDRARVDFSVDGAELTVTVRDEGRGTAPWAAGVGLSAMRDRVEEVGGALVAAGGRDGGTVEAHLPLTAQGRSGLP